MKKIIFAILSIVVIITTFCMSVFGASQNWQKFTFTTDGQTISDEVGTAGIGRIEAIFIVNDLYATALNIEEDVDNGGWYLGTFDTVSGSADYIDLRGLIVQVDIDTLKTTDYNFLQAVGTFTPINETPSAPIEGLYGTCYNLLAHHVYNDVVDTPAVELTLTLASTACSLAVIAIPFILIYKVIRLMG